MIPVDQTTFGKPGGNCFSACVASLLHLPIRDVPYFMGDFEDHDWWREFNDWLRPRGFYGVCFLTPEDNAWWPEGFHIASGSGPRGCDHSVVARGEQIVHDPHPSRAGLLSVNDVVLLVPLDAGSLRFTGPL